MEGIFDLAALLLAVALLGLGFFAGKVAEWRHYRSIREREGLTFKVPAVSFKTIDDPRPVRDVRLAVGSVVVSADYYKRFLMSFRKIFGGEVHSYSSVIDRGRREALLRMKESCPDADLFLNCRLTTSSITNTQGRDIGRVEVVAYGTAIEFDR
jgi:uncharacterized protein YbjQ (UPF0145 family)